MPLPLEPDPDQRRRLVGAVTDYLDSFYAALPDLPVHGSPLQPAEIERLVTPPPEDGRTPEEVMDVVALANRAGPLHASGGHLAYIPNAGLFTGALGAFLASGLNRYTGIDAASPGLSRLESSVLRWFEDLFEMPAEGAAGVLLSGGSMANFTAIVAARTARLAEDFGQGTMYVTDHVHHSITKAARLAGFRTDRIRTVAVDADLRMDTDALASMIKTDRRRGMAPFLIVGTAGTTDTGAIDPLDELVSIAQGEGLWLHVDAAYGGFFQLTERGRKRLVGIGGADSVTLDPHKGLSIPFGVGALLVRDRAALLDANEGKGAYLQDHDDNAVDFAALGPELTRPFRGMHVWLPLQLHGVAAFRSELDKTLDLAEHAYQRLLEADWVEHVWRPDLSIVAFRGRDDDQAHRALTAANATGEVFLSSTTVAGRYTLRLAILNRRTERSHVDRAIDLLASGFATSD